MFVDAAVDSPQDAPWLTGLNPEQRLAVEQRDQHLMIVAGAGTGKTKTLAARVAGLVAEGADPDRILLLTFTRRAAQEMVDRVAAMTDRRAAARVWGGTFHAIANRLLRMHAEPVGLSPSFTVLDQGDASDLMGLVRADLSKDLTGRRFPRSDTIASIHSRMVNSQSKLAKVLDEQFPWCAEHLEGIRAMLREYTVRKRQQQVLDYDDLLLHWRALCVSPEVGEQVCRRFDHVLVDEYQDTNPIQDDIIRSLSAYAQVTVVGDDAQAIYSFRAATVDHLRTFDERFAGARKVTLEQNYRSTNPVLAAANAVLAQSEHHLAKELWSDRSGGITPKLVTCSDEATQSNWVCERILALREEGVSLMEQAVLFRAGHHSDHLELELARRDIPFVKFGGLKFLEAAHVKDLMSLLRVLDNPADQLAWSRVLLSFEGVGPATVKCLFGELGLNGDDAVGSLKRFLNDDLSFPPAARDDLDVLRRAWLDCIGPGPSGAGEVDVDVVAPSVQIDRLRPFCEAVFPRKYADFAARLADLDQLAITASGYRSRARFLTELILDPPERTGNYAAEPHIDDEYLTLSTIHSAKGGEWRAVHLLHAADGNLPSDMALGDEEGLEEERRLLYVALTRAKDHLNVTFPLRYHIHRYGQDDRHHLAPLSRFLEPVRDLFDEQGAGPGTGGDQPSASLPKVNLTDEVDTFLDGLLD
ncbi:MAG: DNA helicase-2/ATP-dependent DNA helicase PcrA [Candidatus Poriferisodalaceae bacterium]|jgi:DNA helicase-2/ATP-dependent DNA helicase PcrA